MNDDFALQDYAKLVRFFEREAEDVGLSQNAGRVLTVLYIAKYRFGESLSTEQIAEFTNYSRSNVGIILSQLEALGLVYGMIDYSQTGRGRRRTLYKISDDSGSIIDLAFKTLLQQMNETVRTIESLIAVYEDDAPDIVQMLQALLEDAKLHLKLVKAGK